MKLFLFVFVILSGCSYYTEADRVLLDKDKYNKQLELVYLEEMRQAQNNADYESFEYFINVYLEVPRLNIPDNLKNHPDYFIGGENVKY